MTKSEMAASASDQAAQPGMMPDADPPPLLLPNGAAGSARECAQSRRWRLWDWMRPPGRQCS